MYAGLPIIWPVRVSSAVAGQELADAEVGDLHAPVARQEDVAGLDVAVEDAPLVRVLERERGLPDDFDPLRERSGRSRDARNRVSGSPSTYSIAM